MPDALVVRDARCLMRWWRVAGSVLSGRVVILECVRNEELPGVSVVASKAVQIAAGTQALLQHVLVSLDAKKTQSNVNVNAGGHT